MFGALLASTGGILAPLSVIAVVMVLGGLFLAGVGPETRGEAFT
jgi:hypothetical protein